MGLFRLRGRLKPWKFFDARRVKRIFIESNKILQEDLTDYLGHFEYELDFPLANELETRGSGLSTLTKGELKGEIRRIERVKERLFLEHLRYGLYYFGGAQPTPDYLEAMAITNGLIGLINEEISLRDERENWKEI